MRETDAALDLLLSWLGGRLSPPAAAWLADTVTGLREQGSERTLYLAFSLAPRRLGKAGLSPSAEERAAAAAVRPGWTPDGWSVDQAARIAVLLSPRWDDDRLAAAIGQLRATADLAEQIALALALPLLPAPPRHRLWAEEAVRSSIVPLFEAVAHDNPYPAEQFDERAWNQMILKALFIGSPLHPVQGFALRRNPELARMAEDFARERRAAGRPVSDDLARCCDARPD